MPRGIFPPKPADANWRKDGRTTRSVAHLWGLCQVPVQLYEHRLTQQHCSIFIDSSLDSSGYSPRALRVLLSFAAQLPFELATTLLAEVGCKLCPSALFRVTEPYAQCCQAEVTRVLEAQLDDPLAEEGRGRLMILQADGVVVSGRPEGGECKGMELRSAVLYPQESPAERYMIADLVQAKKFLPLMSGLLRAAGVRQNDTLLAVSDGAPWLAEHFATLGIFQIIDVYHSASYLERLMKVMGWSEKERQTERQSWLRGEINAKEWLCDYLPAPEIWLSWSGEGQEALRYLESRLEHMDYRDYRAKGWPIGSGQVEGMNKNVIGSRMKRSGMHWSKEGAAGMASLRAQVCSKHPLVSFDALRFKAFPVPSI